jgi:hypothetical protein
VHRRADADARVEPAPGQDVDRRQVLGQAQRIFPAQRDDRGAQLDPAGALGGGGEHGDRRGDAVLQVPVPDPGAVEAEPLAQLDDLQGRLVPGARVGGVEEADGQEAQLPQRGRRNGHSASPRPAGVHSILRHPAPRAKPVPAGGIVIRCDGHTSAELPHVHPAL